MISVEMTVQEMLDLYRNCEVGHELKERILASLEKAVGYKQKDPSDYRDGMYSFYIYGYPKEKRFDCIKVVRSSNTGFGLREAKDWIDNVDTSSCQWSRTPIMGYDSAKTMYDGLLNLGCDLSGLHRSF